MLRGAEDEVDPAVCADDVTDLANLEGVRRVLEGFLHLTLQGRVHDQPKCIERKGEYHYVQGGRTRDRHRWNANCNRCARRRAPRTSPLSR